MPQQTFTCNRRIQTLNLSMQHINTIVQTVIMLTQQLIKDEWTNKIYPHIHVSYIKYCQAQVIAPLLPFSISHPVAAALFVFTKHKYEIYPSHHAEVQISYFCLFRWRIEQDNIYQRIRSVWAQTCQTSFHNQNMLLTLSSSRHGAVSGIWLGSQCHPGFSLLLRAKDLSGKQDSALLFIFLPDLSKCQGSTDQLVAQRWKSSVVPHIQVNGKSGKKSLKILLCRVDWTHCKKSWC